MAISVIGGSTAAPASSSAGWLGLGSVAAGFSSVGNYSIPVARPGAYYLFSSSGTGSKVVFNNSGSGNVWNTNFNGLVASAYSATLGSVGTAANTVSSITFSNIWTQNTTPSSATAAAFGAGLYVFGDLNGNLYSSPDLVTWTSRGNIGAVNVKSIIHNGTVFVAVGTNAGLGTGIVATSPDGITWTVRTSPSASNFDVAFAGSLVVVSANDGIWTSTNFTSWTRTSTTSGMVSVAHNGLTGGSGLFVAVTSGGQIFSSPDATTWTSRTNPAGQAFNSVIYGGGMWVIGCQNGFIISSPDGITWTNRVTSTFYAGTAYNVNSVAYNAGRFVAATAGATNDVTGGFLVSSDGITWRPHGGAPNVAGSATFPRVMSTGNGRFLYNPLTSYISNSIDGLNGGAVGFSLMSPSSPTLN